MKNTILKKFGMEGNGKIIKTEYNTREIEVNGKKESIAVVSYRKFIQELKNNNIDTIEINRQVNECGAEVVKIEIEGLEITVEVNKKEITHCQY